MSRNEAIAAILGQPARIVPTRTSRWARHYIDSTLQQTEIRLDGYQPWDPQILQPSALVRVLLRGTLGAGEGYVLGEWDCAALDELVFRLLRSNIDEKWDAVPLFSIHKLLALFGNRQSRNLARHNVYAHYDIGNDLYEAMLGRTMAYSCGYWKNASTLDEAQDAKHELICRKLSLKPGMHVLDIGCGWGAFARFAAKHYGARVTAVTLSPAQAEFAVRLCERLPVEIREQDFRDVAGQFDRIVSVGMFEHVGPANYRTYFECARRNLANDGLFLLHTIGGLHSVSSMDRWIDRHIFPNAVLPSAKQIAGAAERLFVAEDWHNLGLHYDKTLMAWHVNFATAWPRLAERYGSRFKRMWRYYLLTSAASFRARRNQVWQIVFSKQGMPQGYERPPA